PFASRSSTGTGKRSASSEAPKKAATPATTVAACVVVANDAVAATTVARPATQTGRTTGESFRLAAAGWLILDGVPPEEARQVGLAEHERERDQHGDDHDDPNPRVPLQHAGPPSLSDGTTRLSLSRRPGPSPGRGIGRRRRLSAAEAGFGERPA